MSRNQYKDYWLHHSEVIKEAPNSQKHETKEMVKAVIRTNEAVRNLMSKAHGQNTHK